MTGEPTLRHGDHEKDGWVSYLQGQLAFRLDDVELDRDGYFGDKTFESVKKFQALHHLHTDGVVGDATWAALTNDAPAAEGTDGLAPHTHVDHGLHAVWSEHGGNDDGTYLETHDWVRWFVSNVGDTAVPNNTHTATVSFAEKNYIEFIELITLTGADAANPGDILMVTMEGVKAAVGSGTHPYVAELPAELGSQQRKGEITVP